MLRFKSLTGGATGRALLLALAAAFAFPPPSYAFGFNLTLSGAERLAASFPLDEEVRPVRIGRHRPGLLDNTVFASRRFVQVDHGRGTATISETRGTHEPTPPLVLPWDVYDSLAVERAQRATWRSTVRRSLLEPDTSRSGLLAIDIPVRFPSFVSSIVGEGGAGLRVSGRRRISFTGRSEWDAGLQSTGAYRQSRFPSLTMEQESDFTIDGTIGSKVTVRIDQDSRRDSDLKNTIQLRYRGDEDEIIQEIEAGNTTLSLPNTHFVGYSEHVRGLFGIQARAELGRLSVTAIVSQEKGETQRRTFAAGATVDTSVVRDYDYLEWTYFLMWDPTSGSYSPWFVPGDSIVDVRLYARYGSAPSPTDIPAIAYYNPNTFDSTEVDEGYYSEIEPEDFDIRRGDGEWWLSLERSLTNRQTLAAYYVVEHSDGSRDTVGNLADSTRVLRLLKGESTVPGDPTWNYAWRNVYSLGGRDVSEDGLSIDLYKGTPGAENPLSDPSSQNEVSYVRIVGLDSLDRQGNPNPDNIVDFAHHVNFGRGVLLLPDLRPFDSDVSYTGNPADTLNIRIPSLYDSNDETQRRNDSQYYFRVVSRSMQTSFSLGNVNVIEGSEVVRLNGQRLERGIDYDIIYEVGQIIFFSPDVASPNANVTVDYEYEPFFNPDKKTLFGTRLEYDLGEDSWIGSTVLFKNETNADDRPRIGQESARTWIYDADFALTIRPGFLTSFADALPLVETEAESTVRVTGEVARLVPNPNTRGYAYVDDFEGALETTDMSILRRSWTQCSIPEQLMADSLRAINFADLIWYNPYDRINIADIWPEKAQSIARESDRDINILTFQFTPSDSDATESWAGVARALFGANLDQRYKKFLEVWVKGDGATMHVDLGLVTEDLPLPHGVDVGGDTITVLWPDGILNTEDSPDYGYMGDGLLDDDEDIGVDGVHDTLEVGVDGVPYDPVANPDPHGDNWSYEDPRVYDGINGTEGNRNDADRPRAIDTEDLNYNILLDRDNDYFSYSFDLSTGEFEVDGTMHNGWRLIRVPIQDSTVYETVGDPTFEEIEYVRLWFDGADTTREISVAQIQLVGNKWHEYPVFEPENVDRPGRVNVTVKNTFENADYVPPPGVSGERNETDDTIDKEQSLVLQYEGLNFDGTAMAFRQLSRAENLTGYRRLEMFVHGDSSVVVSPLTFFFRAGRDSSNYYEYSIPLREGWDDSNMVRIVFPDITAVKDAAQQSGASPIDTTVGNYRVVGAPSLSQVLWMGVGVTHDDTTRQYETVTGEVWIDELRVGDVRKDAGWAWRSDLNVQMADVLTVTGSIEQVEADFYDIASKSYRGATSTTGRVSTTLQIGKAAPPSWSMSAPLSVSWQKQVSTPRFRPGSDIELDEQRSYEARTESKTETFDFQWSMNKTGAPFLVKALPNRTRFSYSWSRTTRVDPSLVDFWARAYTTSLNYDGSPRSDPTIGILGWAFFLPNKWRGVQLHCLPQTLTFGSTLAQTRSHTETTGGVVSDSYTRLFTGTVSYAHSLFTAHRTSYNFTTRRDVRDGETVNLVPWNFALGIEHERTQSLDNSFSPRWTRFLDQRYSYRADYTENSNPETQVPAGTRTVSNRNNASAEWAINWREIFGRRAARPQPGQRTPDVGSPAWIWQRIRKAGTTLRPVRLTFASEASFYRPGLVGRPGLSYQFGLSEHLGVASRDVTGGTNQGGSTRRTWRYGVDTGVDPWMGANYTIAYSRRLSRSYTLSGATEDLTVSWPDMALRIGGVEKVMFMRSLARTSTLDFGYSVETSEDRDLISGELTGRGTTKSFDPLVQWAVTWRNGIRTTARATRTRGEQQDLRSTGTSNTAVRSESDMYSFRLDYSFSAPQGIRIPFLRGVRLKSTLTLSLGFTITKDREYTSREGFGFQSTLDRSSWRLEPALSYSFSTKVTGGMTARIENSNDNKTGRKHRVRELSIWTELRF
jgi:hypothetical protein